MTMQDQILKDNSDKDNKKIYFDDLSPITKCLDGCDKCLGYYIFHELESYSTCECSCHQVSLTLDDIKAIVLLHQKSKYSKDYKRHSFSINKSTSFDIINTVFTKQKNIKEVTINVE